MKEAGPGHVLVVDVGGTHSRAALHGPSGLCGVRKWKTRETRDLQESLARYRQEVELPPLRGAAVALAGPVRGNTSVDLTNAAFTARTADLGVPTVLLNDLEAAAWCREALAPGDLQVLQEAPVDPEAPAIFVGLGTGLGAALHLGDRVVPGEPGHASFAPSSSELDALLDWLRRDAEGGQVVVERVLGGAGLGRLLRYAVTRVDPAPDVGRALEQGALMPEALVLEAWGRCPASAMAMSLYLEALGAELAGQALRVLAFGGIYLTGGMSERLAPALGDGRFGEAFCRGPDMRALLQGVPVYLVRHPDPVLLGAAVAARRLGTSDPRN